MKLTDRKWCPISVNELFDKFVPGKCNAVTYLEKSDDGIEYIGATNRNNGVMYHLRKNAESLRMIQPGNCIGFIKDGDGAAGYAIYKQESFVSTVNVIYGYADWLNPMTGLFFIGAQNMIKDKYSHGYKRKINRLKADTVMLPVNEQGKPDFKFMADYEQELLEKKKNYYLKYVHSVLAKLEYVKIQPLSNLQWRTFRIDDLFESVTRPPARSKNKYDEGDIPFIASGASLNGSVKFCRPHENEVPDASNCITVSPVDGSSFYQSTEFLGRGGGGSSIIMLRSQRLNKYNGIFMARAINNTTSKYQYGHMATSDGIKRDQVLLPIDAHSQPDYAYMEQYVKNKMIQKYNDYLQYLNGRLQI